jgi:hypothetical protein
MSHPGQEDLFYLPTPTSALCSWIPALQLSGEGKHRILGNKRNPASLGIFLYSRYSTVESRFGDSSVDRGVYLVSLGVQVVVSGICLFIDDNVLCVSRAKI